MTDGTDATQRQGLDRRNLLKKGVIGGAVAWTAPVVLSKPAIAQTATGGGSVGSLSADDVELSGRRIQIDFERRDLRALVCRNSLTATASGAGVTFSTGGGDLDVRIDNTDPSGVYPFTVRVQATGGPCSSGERPTRPACVVLTFTATRAATGNGVTLVQTSSSVCPAT